MDTLQEVKVFCNQKNTTGALLITGQWGCGKSYFIENTLMGDKDIINKFNVIKISLFGVKSSEQFNLTLKKEYLKVRYPKYEKGFNSKAALGGLGIIKTLATKASPLLDVVVSADWSVFVNIEEFDGKKILLIFDDLERCGLEIDTILGLMNEYIETIKLKTIVIANEEFIFQDSIEKDFQNELYPLMKEKIISRTIKLIPNNEKIINNLINQYEITKNEYKQFLFENSNEINSAFVDGQTNNIRSLKCALQDYERFYNIIVTCISDPNVKSCMLYNFLATLFEYKIGNLSVSKKEKETDNLWTSSYIDYGLQDKYKNYNSQYKIQAMKKWIINGEWDEPLLQSELSIIVQKLKKEEPKDILLNYQNLTFVEDNILTQGFGPLLEDAYAGLLTINDYVTILTMNITSKYFQIQLPCDINYGNFKEGIGIRMQSLLNGKYVEPNNFFINISDDDLKYLDDEAVDLFNTIREFREEIKYKSNRPLILNALNSRNVKTVNELIQKFTGAFDVAYAETILKYYQSICNDTKRYFIKDLADSWKDYRLYSKNNVDSSLNGLKILEINIRSSFNDGKISTALNKIIYNEVLEAISIFTEKKKEYELVLND